MKHDILITGGNGFVGAQVAYEMNDLGHQVTILDRGDKREGLPGMYFKSDFADFFRTNTHRYDTIIHLAAEHIVEQSVADPEKYYTNNVVKMKVMLDYIVRIGIKNIIFSSSGAIYGNQGHTERLTEDIFYNPENPYASTKAAGEMLIKDYSRAYGLNYVNFRYFNVAGADPAGRTGYVQRPATHVIPILCNKIIKGEPFNIYGDDYPTIDGTCMRDYVNVSDLARAHRDAIEFFNMGQKNETFNLGSGNGTSVRQLVDLVSDVVGVEPIIVYTKRRAGDPARLVSDISKAKRLLNWQPQYNIRDSIAHAWAWENSHKAG